MKNIKVDNPSLNDDQNSVGSDFIRKIIEEDIKGNLNEGRIHTRFPPEPNGYLHIGHAKAINLNYSIAEEFNGLFNLRFDDTDPAKEKTEYVDSIINDIRWLGIDWEDRLFFASDYFEQLYDFSVALIKAGKAFVCDLNADEIKETRGSLTEPGVESPYRNRSVEENLTLFEGMRDGKFADGSRVLRAKIDMQSPNLLLRDPVMYRIKRIPHYRRGTDWIIFPSYDWTHGQSDCIEGITHSLCSLEFRTHRELYNWFRDELLKLGVIKHKSRQIEFSRLNMTYTIMSKRKLLQLVEEEYVNSWDDPRMPTLSGLRRRGYPPAAIRSFLNRVGISKRENYIDVGLLESCVREELDKTAPRAMGILQPLKVIITNYPSNKVEYFEVPNHPKDINFGTRKIPFSKELFIEQDDFMEHPPKKFYRLAPGREVRLRYAYFIKCQDAIKNDESDKITEIHCTYDPKTKGGDSSDGRKVKSTLHWVSIPHSIEAEARLYDRLFVKEDPLENGDFRPFINPNSLQKLTCYIEPNLKNAKPGSQYQFERLGYFNVDPIDTSDKKLVFNRTITLRDAWAKVQKHGKKKKL